MNNCSTFEKISHSVARQVGTPKAFLAALLIVAVWSLCGPFFDYSDTWQLIINTGTTIITFLMVFVIQNTQNRDSVAMQVKLDEIIRAVAEARNDYINLEEKNSEEIEKAKKEFSSLVESTP